MAFFFFGKFASYSIPHEGNFPASHSVLENLDKWYFGRAEDPEMIKGYASDQTITRQSSPTSFINDANSSWICILEGMWVGKCWERHCNIGTYKVFVNACKGHSLFRTHIVRLTSSAIPWSHGYLGRRHGGCHWDHSRTLKLMSWVNRLYWDR